MKAVTFGPFQIDVRSLELRRDGALVPLEPLPTRILARLAASPGDMVAREKLLELGWPETPWVAEQSLNTCIYQIRGALAASGPPAVELETLRGRGYRLSVLPTFAGEDDTYAMMSRGRRAAMILVVAGVAGVAIWAVSARHPESDISAEAERILARARYLALETQDLESARAVLDTGRARLPDVAALHAEWGELNVWLGDLRAAARGAQAALELDPHSATAQRTRGVLAILRSDWSAADAALKHALASDSTDTRTLAAFAFLRTVQRRFDDAHRLIQQALLTDPLSATIHQDAGLTYLLIGRYDDAERYCREVLRFRPRSKWATDCLFDVMVLMGRTDEAAIWGRRLLELYDASLPPANLPSQRVVAATEVWRLEGWIDAVDEGAYPFGLALAYAATGRVDEAIEALRSAARRPRLGLLTMAVDPRLTPLQQHPAFKHLQEELGLPAMVGSAPRSTVLRSRSTGPG